MRILIVEDEPKTAAFLRKGLGESGFVVDVAVDGVDGLHHAQGGAYELILLDVSLPGIDGWAVLRGLRERGVGTPVLFLTARDTVDDRVRGLELGADDYLVKPFAFSELLARVRATLRRGPARRPEILRIADLEIDFQRVRAIRQGASLNLTPKEFLLLSLLARHRGEILSRAYIAEQVWDMNFDSDSNVVDVHIRLHDRGIYFRAVHLGNVLITANGDFGLIDISEARCRRLPLSPAMRARNFRPLFAYVADLAAIEEHGFGAFVRTYLDAAELSPRSERRFVAKLRRLSLGTARAAIVAAWRSGAWRCPTSRST